MSDRRIMPEPTDSGNPPIEPTSQLTHVYCMYYFNPYEDWPLHRMSQVVVYDTFEEACNLPEARTGLAHGDWQSIDANWRWRLKNYWIERQRINYAAADSGEAGRE